MTKLEQKLLELGYYYQFDNLNGYLYSKKHNKKYVFNMLLGYDKKHIENYDVTSLYDFRTQEQIDRLQQAFNEMQKDLEILKKIDNLNEETNSQRELANKLWEKDVKHMRELGEWERKQWDR